MDLNVMIPWLFSGVLAISTIYATFIKPYFQKQAHDLEQKHAVESLTKALAEQRTSLEKLTSEIADLWDHYKTFAETVRSAEAEIKVALERNAKLTSTTYAALLAIIDHLKDGGNHSPELEKAKQDLRMQLLQT